MLDGEVLHGNLQRPEIVADVEEDGNKLLVVEIDDLDYD
jgi:hypothetical protein